MSVNVNEVHGQEYSLITLDVQSLQVQAGERRNGGAGGLAQRSPTAFTRVVDLDLNVFVLLLQVLERGLCEARQ